MKKRLSKAAKKAVMQPIMDERSLEATAARIRRYVSELDLSEYSPFSTTELVIVRAMRADWAAARPRDEWNRIGDALCHDFLTNIGERRVMTAYRRLTREGLVRSYQSGGKRYYELNLDWSMPK